MSKAELAKLIKKHIFMYIILAVLSAIIAVFIMMMSYDGISYGLKGVAVFAVWSILYLMIIMQYVYLVNTKQNQGMTVYVVYTVLFISAVLCIVGAVVFNIYAIPFSLCALLTVSLLNKRIAIINNVILASIVMLALIAMPGGRISELSSILVRMSGGMLIAFSIKNEYNRIRTIGAAALVSAAITGFSLLASLLTYRTFTEVIIVGAWVLGSEMVAILLMLCLSPIIEWVFRLNTNFHLIEYISFDQPLLKEMSKSAPGTFNHSLAVGTLAERCAFAIGENVNLAKAAGYYHDVGKMQNPEFFAENQLDGYNPHDELIFETSVNMITRHTEVGYQMLTSKGFPKEIANAAREHHGDSPLNYFYIKAQNITEGDLDSGDYRYSGPRPTSKISAIIMISDAVEAATRAMGANTKDKISEIVDSIIANKMEYGQFDDCDITMKDINDIKNELITALEGQYHTRIVYPDKIEE